VSYFFHRRSWQPGFREKKKLYWGGGGGERERERERFRLGVVGKLSSYPSQKSKTLPNPLADSLGNQHDLVGFSHAFEQNENPYLTLLAGTDQYNELLHTNL
jgi:hypothetical protein